MDSDQIQSADIVHLHWIEGVVSLDWLEKMNLEKRGIFWTLHDMRPFTGCCHFAGKCDGFANGCSNCPMVRSGFEGLVSSSFNTRSRLIGQLKPTFIAPGSWMQNLFKKSQYRELDCLQIPYALDQSFFSIPPKPGSVNKIPTFGFIAADLSDKRKGLAFARQKIRLLVSNGHQIRVQLVGNSPPKDLDSWETYIGHLKTNEVANWMSSIDFLIFTSTDDNSPLVVAQALASGTPLLMKEGTGADDMVTFGKNALRMDSISIEQIEAEMKSRNMARSALDKGRLYRPSEVAKKTVGAYERKIEDTIRT